MTLPTWTNQQILDQLVFGTSWLSVISDTAILYRFPTSSSGVYTPNGETSGFKALNTDQMNMARLAFATWDDLIATPIVETTKSWPNIDVANTSATDFAHAYFPTQSSIWFNRNEPELQHPQVGENGFETFIHEIGHALGLEHMGDYNGAGNWTPSCYQDSTVYSVMSYFGPDHADGENQVAWADWTVDGVTYAPQTPMVNDILAIQDIYGADTATRLGNTVYGFHSNITGSTSAIFDFARNLHPIITIYDAGGIDTLDLSGWSSSSSINLNPGAFGDANGMTKNINVAYSCVLDNLMTGSGDDTLIGNVVANILEAGGGNDQLEGGAGDDVLDGGIGFDTAIFDGALAEYAIGFNGTSVQVTHRASPQEDRDTLLNIESIKFDDLTASYSLVTPAVNGAVPEIGGHYANYLLYAQDGSFSLINPTTSTQVVIYEDTERVQFDDLMAASDLGKGEATGEVYRLYLSVLGRNPDVDPVGCGFWIDKLDRGLTDIEGLVNTFLGSDEFVSRFGSTTSSNESFVNLLYLNLLNRDGHPDPGFQFWQSILDTNRGTRAQVVVGFMESNENVANIAALIGDHATYAPWVEGA